MDCIQGDQDMSSGEFTLSTVLNLCCPRKVSWAAIAISSNQGEMET
jgi:hypothetical protein